MLSTKEIKAEVGTSKTFQPSNLIAKINSIETQVPNYQDMSKNPVFLVLNLEGVAEGPEFTGFQKDRDDPRKGNYEGKIGRVKYSQYPFRDGESKTGKKYTRTEGVLRAMVTIAEAEGKRKELDELSEKCSTIEELVLKSNSFLAGDTFYQFAVGGREYDNKGYVAYDMHLVSYEAGKVAIESLDVKPELSKIIKYDSNNPKHLQKMEPVQKVSSFSAKPAYAGDEDLDDEQDSLPF